MSALGDRLRRASTPEPGDLVSQSFAYAARVADEHEAAALAESAQGRGPHAAAVLRWAAIRGAREGQDATWHSTLMRWADEAER